LLPQVIDYPLGVSSPLSVILDVLKQQVQMVLKPVPKPLTACRCGMRILEGLIAFLVDVANIEPEPLFAPRIAQPYGISLFRLEYLKFAVVADDERAILLVFIYDLDGHTPFLRAYEEL
jgi:hypothetical protein